MHPICKKDKDKCSGYNNISKRNKGAWPGLAPAAAAAQNRYRKKVNFKQRTDLSRRRHEHMQKGKRQRRTKANRNTQSTETGGRTIAEKQEHMGTSKAPIPLQPQPLLDKTMTERKRNPGSQTTLAISCICPSTRTLFFGPARGAGFSIQPAGPQ